MENTFEKAVGLDGHRQVFTPLYFMKDTDLEELLKIKNVNDLNIMISQGDLDCVFPKEIKLRVNSKGCVDQILWIDTPWIVPLKNHVPTKLITQPNGSMAHFLKTIEDSIASTLRGMTLSALSEIDYLSTNFLQEDSYRYPPQVVRITYLYSLCERIEKAL